MILDGVGLMGDGGHTVNETADLSDAAVADQARGAAVVSAVALTGRPLRPSNHSNVHIDKVVTSLISIRLPEMTGCAHVAASAT